MANSDPQKGTLLYAQREYEDMLAELSVEIKSKLSTQRDALRVLHDAADDRVRLLSNSVAMGQLEISRIKKASAGLIELLQHDSNLPHDSPGVEDDNPNPNPNAETFPLVSNTAIYHQFLRTQQETLMRQVAGFQVRLQNQLSVRRITNGLVDFLTDGLSCIDDDRQDALEPTLVYLVHNSMASPTELEFIEEQIVILKDLMAVMGEGLGTCQKEELKVKSLWDTLLITQTRTADIQSDLERVMIIHASLQDTVFQFGEQFSDHSSTIPCHGIAETLDRDWREMATNLEGGYLALLKRDKSVVDVCLHLIADEVRNSEETAARCAAYRRGLEKCSGTIENARKSLVHWKQTLESSIRRIPREVWARIFYFVVEDSITASRFTYPRAKHVPSILRLSWVSSLWYSVAHENCNLWRYIVIPNIIVSFSHLDVIQYKKQVALFKFVCEAVGNYPVEISTTPTPMEYEHSLTIHRLNILGNSAWSPSINIPMAYFSPAQPPAVLCIHNHPSPIPSRVLEHVVSLVLVGSNVDLPFTPKLKHLVCKLTGSERINICLPSMPSLETLEISCSLSQNTMSFFGTVTWSGELSVTHGLRSLSLHGFMLNSFDNYIDGQQSPLKPRELCIHMLEQGNWSTLQRIINIVPLKKLDITYNSQWLLWDCDTVFNLLRSCGPLISLKLTVLDYFILDLSGSGDHLVISSLQALTSTAILLSWIRKVVKNCSATYLVILSTALDHYMLSGQYGGRTIIHSISETLFAPDIFTQDTYEEEEKPRVSTKKGKKGMSGSKGKGKKGKA